MERPALRTRLFGSAQDPACWGGDGALAEGPISLAPQVGVLHGQGQRHRLVPQATGLRPWVSGRAGACDGDAGSRQESSVATTSSQPQGGCDPSSLFCALNSDARSLMHVKQLVRMQESNLCTI